MNERKEVEVAGELSLTVPDLIQYWAGDPRYRSHRLILLRLKEEVSRLIKSTPQPAPADAVVGEREHIYRKAFEIWNYRGPQSTEWSDLDAGEKARWIRAIDNATVSAFNDIPQAVVTDDLLKFWVDDTRENVTHRMAKELQSYRRLHGVRR